MIKIKEVTTVMLPLEQQTLATQTETQILKLLI